MSDEHHASVSRTQELCHLQRDGRHLSLLLTDLGGPGFELRLVRSDAAIRSVRFFGLRHEALREANRQLHDCIADGWALCGSRMPSPTIMPTIGKRETRAAPVDDWPDLPLPDSAATRRRVAAVLVLLALAALVAHVVSLFVT